MVKKRFTYTNHSSGFTIIELLIVIVIIGILAAVTITSYLGTTASAKDASVQSDIDRMDATETGYGVKNNTVNGVMQNTTVVGRAWYSGNGYDAALGFTPSSGNVIDVVVNSTDYCIRGFNANGTKNNIYNSFTKESSPGACTLLGPSATAIAAYNGPKVWQQISVGGSYNPCVIASNNQAYCWGSNGWGELGNNSTTPSLVPVAVDTSGVLSGKTILSISTSADHSCAIASDNLAYCWGYNQSGQLGNNSTTQSLVPVAVYTGGVLSGKTVKSIVPQSVDHTCAIASDNLAYCWGSNSNGQLGNNSTTQSSVPVAVDTSGVLSGKTINTIITGNAYTCAIASDNLAYCWGYNNFGQLGNNSTTQSLVPVAVNTSGVLSGKTVMSITSTSASVCAIASDNLAYCWGNDNYGQLGNNSTTQSQVPVAVNTSGVLSGKTIVSITTGNLHTCAIASDYQAYCWGYNVHGALGNNSTTDSHVPVAVNTSGVLSGKTIRSIAGGIYHTCAIASDYHAYCWGWNINGELGNNSNTESDVPVAVNPLP